MNNPWLVDVGDVANTHPIGEIVLKHLISMQEAAMAAKAAKKKARKRSKDAGLKRSTSRARSRSRRPREQAASDQQVDTLKSLIPQQPISAGDQSQAEGHGNQRALMARAQVQVGEVSGAEGLMPKDELIGAINQLSPDNLALTFRQVTEGYAEILRYETEKFIGRVKEALG